MPWNQGKWFPARDVGDAEVIGAELAEQIGVTYCRYNAADRLVSI